MKLLVTCSGVSNTGKLTTQVAQTLMRSRPGVFEWVQARKPPGDILACAAEADDIIVIDGCSDCCATKKLGTAGITGPCRCHVVATECGVVKNGMADVRYEEIAIVADTVVRMLNGGGT